jgi:ribosome-associated heat shock protein Hsp15
LDAPATDRQRIDKWLWHARVVRTRSAAAGLAAAGHVRINGQRVDAPSRVVRPGDVVTVALDRAVRVLKVLGFAERRGSADDARMLCETLVPAPGQRGHSTSARPGPPPALREAGAGRPSKRERRAIDRFTGEDES